MRMKILQSYVNDLSDQNEVLVKTVEELEKEANDRVALLEDKLNKKTLQAKVWLTKCMNNQNSMKLVIPLHSLY